MIFGYINKSWFDLKYFVNNKKENKSPFKEWFCPSGHVGLECNDSQCRPPETNCH